MSDTERRDLPQANILQRLQQLRRVSRVLWVRVALILALSVFAALAAELLDPLIPQGPKDRFTAAATLPILTILANSMLAVATFSLGVMVSSHRTMAEQTTPRIHRLLMEDTSTQTMLATFLGAFAFALSSIILFRAGYYSDSASVIVFAATVLVVIAIIVSLVRWIHQLSRIGSMDYALERAERTAKDTLHSLKRWPNLGGKALQKDDIPGTSNVITAPTSGFLQRLEMQNLQDCTAETGGQVFVQIMPGDLILRGQAMAYVTGDADAQNIAKCFVIAANRSPEQDPRYAIQAMRETASKALSPGINDPGTAVEVVGRLERLLWDGLSVEADEDGPLYDRVFVKSIANSTLIETAFRDISRDGAAFVEVLIAVSNALDALASRDFADDADAIDALRTALQEHADHGLKTENERSRFEAGISQES
ncbi:DUF2254 domain-containing protein [Roseovarius sp. 2305UL8-3]|uniref:DUF2254 domain-containing protein n=1 Tax=Roseovarius conchicola TaxID=3121636 RepID=UPI003527F856